MNEITSLSPAIIGCGVIPEPKQNITTNWSVGDTSRSHSFTA